MSDVIVFNTETRAFGVQPGQFKCSGYGLGAMVAQMDNPKVLEIGCDIGDTTQFLLDSNPNCVLTGIDPYVNYIDWNGNNLNEREEVYQRFMKRMEPYKGRFALMRDYSDNVADKLLGAWFDVIFIDGLHEYDQLTKDCANYYSKLKGYWCPMDIEWGKDGRDGKLYILQARPETVKSQEKAHDAQQKFRLKGSGTVLTSGRAIGQKIGAGPVRVINDPSEMERVQPGDVLVADMTDPNWEPVMKRASAIVTNRGGRTCHAAIIARELGVPAVVGCGDATEALKDGTLVTVSCAEGDEGKIYDGLLETEITEEVRGELPELPVKIMLNVGNPQLAFDFQSVPNQGVGLARLEFIINNNIGVHPKAILEYPNIDPALKKAVESVARGHASPKAFYVDKLAEGVATIAAAFWPKKVIVRLSDFKSNEYKKLIGGSRYEPDEENPMLGFRGAARYIAQDFGAAFEMECQAMRRVRDEMGLTNVELMVPFVRTLPQAARVIDLLAKNGLKRGENGLRVIMMCEVPSNAILAEQFLEYFDGFSIGSNDLTQLTLGLDRDSGMELLAADFDERDPAVRALLSKAIAACRAAGKYVGICGQGPSDHPDFAEWLMQEGIESISLNPDSVVETWKKLAAK